jgi:hypothetical protein
MRPACAVPTTGEALFPWLQAGSYKGFPAESGPHASSGPHGGVRTWIDPTLEASLRSGAAEHPQCAAAIKEIYVPNTTTLRGWAVEVKIADASDGGNGWYWYEIFSTTDGANPVVNGDGASTCTGCHARGKDYVTTPFPLQ